MAASSSWGGQAAKQVWEHLAYSKTGTLPMDSTSNWLAAESPRIGARPEKSKEGRGQDRPAGPDRSFVPCCCRLADMTRQVTCKDNAIHLPRDYQAKVCSRHSVQNKGKSSKKTVGETMALGTPCSATSHFLTKTVARNWSTASEGVPLKQNTLAVTHR
ncbi:hypothetical protein [Desulfurivibrio alkaliphilus]|uniref:hypothetical protein n=1 Tax=Desulfurivibrio alkaliphilus TaxID=427923 RepID=UPI0012FF3780|nr:hypothetical protein [Desulfurivibrio alkaliphilus]